MSSAKGKETQSVYEMYYEFEEAIDKIAGHRVLALNRGEKEKILTVKIAAPEPEGFPLRGQTALLLQIRKSVQRRVPPCIRHGTAETVWSSCRGSADRLRGWLMG